MVPCDIRGEWVPVVQAVDGTVLRLGPGMPHRLNALAMPEKPAGTTEQQWWLTVRTHWEELLVALIETVLRGSRDLTPTETTAIEVAITEATRYSEASGNLDRLAPIHLHLIVDLLLNPTPTMATETHMTVADLADLLRESGLALRKLTRGSLQGLVDAPEANQLDPRSPATVVDISRVQTSDASIALVMACTQAATELAWAHSVGQRWHVYDEFWRIATFGKLVARLDGGRRISRKTGAADMIVSHRGTDGMRGDEQAQRAAKDLMDNCATKVTYRQRGDSVTAAGTGAGMPDMAAMLLPTLTRGRGGVDVGGTALRRAAPARARRPGVVRGDRPGHGRRLPHTGRHPAGAAVARRRLTTTALLIAASISTVVVLATAAGCSAPRAGAAAVGDAGPRPGPGEPSAATAAPPSRPAPRCRFARPGCGANRERLGRSRFSMRSRIRRGCWRCRRISPAPSRWPRRTCGRGVTHRPTNPRTPTSPTPPHG